MERDEAPGHDSDHDAALELICDRIEVLEDVDES